MPPSRHNKNGSMDPITRRRLAGMRYESAEQAYASTISATSSIFERLKLGQSISREEKKVLERYQAALFAFITKELAGPAACTLEVAVEEDDDFDCVIRATTPNGQDYRPIQLKEVPSRSSDAQQALQEQILKLQRYVPELSVGIWINCEGRIRLERLSFDDLRIEQLWLFGTVADGETAVHGGCIADWVDGCCWSGRLSSNGGRIQTKLKRLRFRHSPNGGPHGAKDNVPPKA
jgi:hypothetical protein